MRTQNGFQFVLRIQIFCETSEVAIAGYDNRLIIMDVLNHTMENKFRIHISFAFSVRVGDSWFENKSIAVVLQ